MITKFIEYIKEELPFDSYPGPPLITKPADYINYLYPTEDELEDTDRDAKHGYGFSFPYHKNGPFITRWSGDNISQLGISGGQNGGRIGGEFDSFFSPGGEIERDIPENDDVINTENSEESEKKQRILNFLQHLEEK